MSRIRLVIGLIILAVVMVGLAFASPAQAQEPTPENDENCVSCHEDQYYLYDSGKWFCLCEAPMHCIYCHGGRTDSYVEEVAHQGLVLYPTRQHAERCQTCHAEDYMGRIVKFDAIAGISSSPVAVLTATPQAAIGLISGESPTVSFTRLGQLEAWRLAGLGVLTVVFLLVIAFGYRCWKLDCLSRKQSS